MTELNYQFICEKQEKEIKQLAVLKKIQVAINQAQSEVLMGLVEASRKLSQANESLEDDLEMWTIWGDTIVKQHKEQVEKLEIELGLVKFSNEEYKAEVGYIQSHLKFFKERADRYYNQRGWWHRLTAYVRGE